MFKLQFCAPPQFIIASDLTSKGQHDRRDQCDPPLRRAAGLRNVSLHVDRGEVLALMAPNGMGKTTLLGVIAGALWPIEGIVKIDGKIRRSTTEAERRDAKNAKGKTPS